jgi:hypothetical protein
MIRASTRTASVRFNVECRVKPSAVRFTCDDGQKLRDERCRSTPIVLAGLDRAIQPSAGALPHPMDARVKPAHDNEGLRGDVVLSTALAEPDSRGSSPAMTREIRQMRPVILLTAALPRTS